MRRKLICVIVVSAAAVAALLLLREEFDPNVKKLRSLDAPVAIVGSVLAYDGGSGGLFLRDAAGTDTKCFLVASRHHEHRGRWFLDTPINSESVPLPRGSRAERLLVSYLRNAEVHAQHERYNDRQALLAHRDRLLAKFAKLNGG